MRILVAYATRHGATRGIAERIAGTLERPGLEVTLRPVNEADSVAEYDAFVIGGAAYMYHWMKDATRFVRRHRTTLAGRPVWLFSSGPLGTERVDPDGQDALEGAVPREFTELAAEIHPRGQQVFFGAYDPTAKPIGILERLTRIMPASKEALPVGDFRDWPAIQAWAEEVARTLQPATPATVAGT
jgi:menaquinone-dependent protoporphyrinogen oxidase